MILFPNRDLELLNVQNDLLSLKKDRVVKRAHRILWAYMAVLKDKIRFRFLPGDMVICKREYLEPENIVKVKIGHCIVGWPIPGGFCELSGMVIGRPVIPGHTETFPMSTVALDESLKTTNGLVLTQINVLDTYIHYDR